ncbi:MAG: hypothetical protein KBE04_08145 [Phycisphaerae bacterium]|nr:hypothetical protein [Phycisphaerae bacterium]
MFEKKYLLLRSQKKRVYEMLREAGLEPGEFSWVNEVIVDAYTVSKLCYREGQYSFQFSSFELNSFCEACPGAYRSVDLHYPKNWEEQEQYIYQWAQSLKREKDSPDVWADVERHRLALNGEITGDLVNEPIPAVEADRIGQALTHLADSMTRELALEGDKAQLVSAKLTYLAEAARRERSRDWMYMALGVWTSLVSALGVTDDQAAWVRGMAKADLGPFISLLAHGRAERQAPLRKRILGIVPVSGQKTHKADKEKTVGQSDG